MISFGSREEAIAHGRKEGWLTLFYGNLVLDGRSFVNDHPGGSHVLSAR
jgi:hypothetical protein